MKYRKIDAKYDLPEPDSRLLAVHGFDIDTPRIRLTPDGMMTLKQYYTWDGASGPTIDTVDYTPKRLSRCRLRINRAWTRAAIL